MSNFICPTCGLTNIDCGKSGYKTAREIELEKKLEIAVYIKGQKVKEYPCKLQAIIYLMLKGFCYQDRYGKWLDKRTKIVKVKR